MELIERIETTRFLGAEFLVWLWFCSETFDGKFEVEGEELEVWLDSPLSLESQLEPGERIALRGLHPSGSAEAKEALRQNKLPSKARLIVRSAAHEYSLTLDAATLGVSSAQVPAVLSRDEHEGFLERMELLEGLGRKMDALFVRFVRVRLSPQWTSRWTVAMGSWVAGEPLRRGVLEELAAARTSRC
jgi:hypothetical protein